MTITDTLILTGIMVAIFVGGFFCGIQYQANQQLRETAKIEVQDTKAAAKANHDLTTLDQKIDTLRNQPAPVIHYEKDCNLPSSVRLHLIRK